MVQKGSAGGGRYSLAATFDELPTAEELDSLECVALLCVPPSDAMQLLRLQAACRRSEVSVFSF